MSANCYEILSGDTLVALWQNGKLLIKNKKLLPLYLKNYSNGDLWLASRAIDAHRAHSRLLKKALRMTERDDVQTVLRANGVTITDNYWVRSLGSDLNYTDVRFDAAYFKKRVSKSIAKLAYSGSSSAFNVVAENSEATAAELTNTGSFEKCWKMKDGNWWLYKEASQKESFSEVFISCLCFLTGIRCVVYEKGQGYVKTPDFTEGKINFEPAFTFMGEEEDYSKTVDRLFKICPEAVQDYIKMIFLDALVFNPDRHTANFGLLRDQNTGEFLSLAPCFDHNMALIARGYPSGKMKSDLLIDLFLELMRIYPGFWDYIPEVTESHIDQALKITNMKVKSHVVKEYILFRYGEIIKGRPAFTK